MNTEYATKLSQTFGEWANTTEFRIALIGDSTLDNGTWVGINEASVPQHLLKSKEGANDRSFAVRNLAVDGFTTSDVLTGYFKNIVNDDDIPTASSSSPLQVLKGLNPPPTHIVLSVGGNDVRETLGPGVDRVLMKTIQKMQQNYLIILNECLSVCKKTILMFQYRPCFTTNDYEIYDAMNDIPDELIIQSGALLNGDKGMEASHDKVTNVSVRKLNMLMESIYNGILLNELILANRLPIIDLPNTFDIHNSLLYVCQIEPSHWGGLIIAKLVHHVIENHWNDVIEEEDGKTNKNSIFYSLNTKNMFNSKKLDPKHLKSFEKQIIRKIFNEDDVWKITIDETPCHESRKRKAGKHFCNLL